MDLWNQINLLAPPTFTFKAENRDLDLVKLRNALYDAVQHFKDQGFISREAALLARVTYRMKMKFRSAKDFKSLEKVSHALDRYFSCMNINSYFKLLLSLTPKEYRENIYLPTRNMFAYVLVKLQGLAKLMERIHDSCKIAACLTTKRMSIGHFWKLSAIVFALISRIYVLVKFNCQFICDLYAKLYSHSMHLKNTAAQWLPKGYELPTDLRVWLGVQWVYEEEYIDLTNEPLPHILDFFDISSEDDEDVEFCDEYVLIDEDNELNDFRNLKQKKLEKSGLFKMVPKLTKAEKKKKAIEYREQKKQAKKDARQKQTMRGFSTDIDCGEVITLDDSLNDDGLIQQQSKSIDANQLKIIQNFKEFKKAGSSQEPDEVFDEYFFNDDGDDFALSGSDENDVVQESGSEHEITSERDKDLEHEETNVKIVVTSDEIKSSINNKGKVCSKVIDLIDESDLNEQYNDFSSVENYQNKGKDVSSQEIVNIDVNGKAIRILDDSNKTITEIKNSEPKIVLEKLKNTLRNGAKANISRCDILEESENKSSKFSVKYKNNTVAVASDKISKNCSSDSEVIELFNSEIKSNIEQPKAKSKKKTKKRKTNNKTQHISKDCNTNILKEQIKSKTFNKSTNNSVSQQLKKKRSLNKADLDISENQNKKMKISNKLITSTPIKMPISEDSIINISTIVGKKVKKAQKKVEVESEINDKSLAQVSIINISTTGKKGKKAQKKIEVDDKSLAQRKIRNSTIKKSKINKTTTSLASPAISSSLSQLLSNDKINKSANKNIMQTSNKSVTNKLKNASMIDNYSSDIMVIKKGKKIKSSQENSYLDDSSNAGIIKKLSKRKGHFANQTASPKKKKKIENKSMHNNSSISKFEDLSVSSPKKKKNTKKKQ